VVTPDFTSPTATYEIPSAEWTGKETILAVRVTAANGKQSGWSNFVIVPVVPAPAVPEGVTPAGTARGVQVTWRASGPRFRVLRKGEGGEYAVVATVEEPQWLDQTAELGGKYTYLVQTLVPLEGGRLAESELSAPAAFTYEDRFAPAAPAGLRATAAPQSIELTWDRNGEADLAGYRVYRAVGDGAMERVAELAQIPSYSDRAIEPGKTYRYAVAAFDRAGNESQHSAEARATAEVR
jgi:fibronectin type 3 domain-containing protein